MVIDKSIVRRYLILSVLASTLPVLSIGLLYDRFTGTALEQLLGEKVAAHVTTTANRLSAFIEARRYQVETLANYPGISGLARGGDEMSDEIGALLQIESDLPDLYGILLFDAEGRLKRVVPGQAAAGPPYWADRPFAPARLPMTKLGETEIIGPMAAANGDSGWLLVRHPLRGQQEQTTGYIALHVRLASLTEQLGSSAAANALQPLLRTPAGDFNAVGQSVIAHEKLVSGPEILPGWRPLLEIESAGVMKAFEFERRALLAAVLLSAALIVFLFFRLSRHLRNRIRKLLSGTEAISSGQLDHRIADQGSDEIATLSHALDAMACKLQDHVGRAVRTEKLVVLGEFATGIAHEIRNPLAAIKTSVQALFRRETDTKRQQLLTDMESEIDRLARVVSDLVDFGRPRQPAPANVPIREVFRQIAEIVKPEALRGGVYFSSQGDSQAQAWVDRDHFVQILLNLAMNAVQATPAGGSVVINASFVQGKVEIEVSDSGCGIPPDVLERVTDPFFTTKTKGVGLGLSISRQLCEMNAGQIIIESAPGHGTIVRVRLPFANAHHVDDPDH
jgi:two-component system, NtrC family, sensor histidine kinase HydH